MNNPTASMIGSGIQGLSSIIGAIITQGEMKRARQEARDIDERNYREDTRRNAFQEGLATESMGLNKAENKRQERTQRINEMQSGRALSKDMISKVEELFSNNVALRNNVMKNWSY